MDKQLIISIGREFGSGGHEIAEKLAKRFHLTLYDKNLLQCMSEEKNMDEKSLAKYDEKPRNKFLTRTVRGYTNSAEENLFHMQFDFLMNKAEAGESFVIVGRCAETMLRKFPSMISIFVLGDWDNKVDRVTRLYNLNRVEAESFIYRQDSKRKTYHNYYCKGKWGDSRNYDISINSSKLGEEKTTDILEEYINRRIENR